MNKPLSPDVLQKMNAYWRAANYLSVGQIYLYPESVAFILQNDAITVSQEFSPQNIL
jgi:phosphoketolase